MKRESSIEKIADVIALVIKQPRTIDEITKVTGQTRQSVARYLAALEGEGLMVSEKASIAGQNAQPKVWRWLQ